MTADDLGIPPGERVVERGDPELSARPGDGALPRTEAVKDERVRRWDVVTPSATLVGRPDDPAADLPERLRRLHEERHPATGGHGERMHRLDRARITHALCNALSVTPWQRDRALGVMAALDLRAFGSQRAVPKVALVVIRHVVDADRRRRLGLDDQEWVADRSPEEMAALADRFESLTAEERYPELLAAHGLDVTAVNRLDRVLDEQLAEQGIDAPALGRSPYRDAAHPPVRDGEG
ncbi:MAG: DNA-directed RNA polymerase subunit epsilon [Halobacteriaceae archaeon]